MIHSRFALCLPFAAIAALLSLGCNQGASGGSFNYTLADGTTVDVKEVDPLQAKKLYKVSAAIDAAKAKAAPKPGQPPAEPDDKAIQEALKTVKVPAPDDPRKTIEVDVKPEEVAALKTDPLMSYMVMGQKLCSIAAMGGYKAAAGTAPKVDGIVAIKYRQQPPAVTGQPARPATSGLTLFPSSRLEEIKKQPGITLDGVYPASFGLDSKGNLYIVIEGIGKLDPHQALVMASRMQYNKTPPDPLTGEPTSLPGFAQPVSKMPR